MNNNAKYLLSLTSAALRRVPAAEPDENINQEALFSLAKFHNIACLVYPVLSGLSGISDEIKKKFEAQYSLCMIQQINRDYEVEKLFAFCNENKIRLVPLKGWWLRELYPDPVMRSSCDADIYADKADFPAITEFLLSQGFTQEQDLEIHRSFSKPPYVEIELHHEVQCETFVKGDNRCFTPFTCSEVVESAGEYILRLNPPDFYVQIVGHMARHFSNCGTGVRSVADIYVYYNKYKDELDTDYCRAELESGKLADFERNIRELARIWFDGSPSDEFYDELGEYILSSGVYGNSRNFMSVNVANEKNSNYRVGKLRYLLWLMFPGIDRARLTDPWLCGWKVMLLPFAWIKNIFVAAFITKRWKTLKAVNNLDNTSVERTKRIFDRLGVKKDD